MYSVATAARRWMDARNHPRLPSSDVAVSTVMLGAPPLGSGGHGSGDCKLPTATATANSHCKLPTANCPLLIAGRLATQALGGQFWWEWIDEAIAAPFKACHSG